MVYPFGLKKWENTWLFRSASNIQPPAQHLRFISFSLRTFFLSGRVEWVDGSYLCISVGDAPVAHPWALEG